MLFSSSEGVQLFVTPGTAECQASQSFTISQNFLKLMFIESVMPSTHLILCRPLLFLPLNFKKGLFQWVSSSQVAKVRAPASTSVLPMTIQDWFLLGLAGSIFLQSKTLSRVFSNTTFKSISSLVFSFLYGPTLTTIHDYWKNHNFD